MNVLGALLVIGQLIVKRMNEITYLGFNLMLWVWILLCLFAIGLSLVILFLCGYAIYRLVRLLRVKFSATSGTPRSSGSHD